jgi:3-phenylpropionate/trans-cinnamate dioxygenase ferredoxin reductase subunit
LKNYSYDTLIIGSGHSGSQVAATLRQRNFDGTIALLGDEREFPYERPPLSKEYLSGERSFDNILVRRREFWTEQNIQLIFSQRVVSVDPMAHSVTTESGSTFSYKTLVWAAGGTPRRLTCPGHKTRGLHVIRNRVDVDAILKELPDIQQAVVVGGGYIGLEAAATLRKLEKDVTVLEAQNRVLARVAGEPLSRFYEAEHRKKGVDIRLGETVESITEASNRRRVEGVKLSTGEILPADLVIVGIGITPNVGPLAAAGAAGDDGVDVDNLCRSSLPDIFAIGDCAAHNNEFAGGKRVRIESVQNAIDQATTVAKVITGIEEPYKSVPRFWSDQFDLRLQSVGLSKDHDAVVIRGNSAKGSFSVIYLNQGSVIALDCVNATSDFVQGRALVATHARPSLDQLGDLNIPLKQLVTKNS